MTNLALTSFITGFLTSLGLIVAIGAQNTFILRQGIRREYILLVAVTCFLCDIVLVSLGVLGVGSVINHSKIMMLAMTGTGVLFLIWYGYNALQSAWRGNSHLVLSQCDGNKQSWQAVLLTALAVTFLNPNALLDTLVIIGGISTSYIGYTKLVFMAGTLTASFIWFFSLGYLAALLSGYFSNAITWRILDLLIGVYMLFMACKLFLFVLQLI